MKLETLDHVENEDSQSLDFTKATMTTGGYKVAGLFRDGRYIRGYVRVKSGDSFRWSHYTWFFKNGEDIIKGDSPSPVDLKL